METAPLGFQEKWKEDWNFGFSQSVASELLHVFLMPLFIGINQEWEAATDGFS